MKVTHRELMEGAKLTFAECFKMEYRLSQGCMVGTKIHTTLIAHFGMAVGRYERLSSVRGAKYVLFHISAHCTDASIHTLQCIT